MLRASDAPEKHDTVGNYQSAFERIEQEIKTSFSTSPEFVGTILHRHIRGAENALVFISEIREEPGKGQFFSVDALPKPLIEHHRSIIAFAITGWNKLKK